MAFDPFADKGSAAPFDPFSETSQQTIGTLPTQKKQNTSLIGDIGTGLKRGALQIPGMVTGLADIASAPISAVTGINKPNDRAAAWLGEKTGFQPSKWAEDAQSEYSPEMQQAISNVDQAKGFFPTLKAVVENPRVGMNLVAESLPSTLVGGLAARGAMGAVVGAEKLAALRAASATGNAAAKQALLKAGSIAGGIGEGAVTAGQQMDQTDESVNPLRAAGSAIGAGVGTGVLGAVGGRLATRIGLPDVDTMIAAGTLGNGVEATATRTARIANTAKRMATGATQEGIFEELPQSAQEQVWQNIANGKPWDEGVGEAAAQGAIAGGLMGGGVNLMPRGTSKQEASTAPTQDQSQQEPQQEVARLPHLADAPMIVFPDGSTGTQAQFDEYIKSLPPEQRASAMGQMLYGQPPGTPTVEQADPNIATVPNQDGTETVIDRRDGPLSAAAVSSVKNGVLRERDFVPPPSGSFGQMNELASLIESERTDVEGQRKQIGERQQLKRDSELETADLRVEAQRAQETARQRDALLANVLENLPEGQNPSRAFDRALRAVGFTDTAFRPEEVRTIDAWKNLAPVQQEAIPSAPNELDPAALGIRERRVVSPEEQQKQREIEANRLKFEATRQRMKEQRNGTNPAAQANAEMVAPSLEGASRELPGSGTVLSPAPVGDGERTGNRAEVAGSSVRPAVPAGTASAPSLNTNIQPEGVASNGATSDQTLEGQTQRTEAQPAAAVTRAYPLGQAQMIAGRMTKQGLPSEIYPHPTDPAKYAIRAKGQGEAIEAAAPQESMPTVTPEPTAQPLPSAPARRPVKPATAPIMRRDDLVGAIMRATGGRGIHANMATTLTGDTANRVTRLRGLFTNQGQQDMDDLALRLREEEGFDVRDGTHLEELVREAAGGNVAVSMARQEQNKQAQAEKEHRDTIRQKAKDYGIKTVARKFDDIAKDVSARELEDSQKAQREAEEEARLEREAIASLADDALEDDTINELLQLAAEDGRQINGEYIDNEQIQAAFEPIGEGGEEQGTDGAGETVAAETGGTGQERSEEARPDLTLQGQTPAEVRAQEAQRQAEEARTNRPEPDTSPRVKADQVDLFNTQGGLFNSNRDSQSTTADLPSVDTASAPVASTEQAQPDTSTNNEETIFVRKGDRFKDGQGKEYEVWSARSSLIEAFPIVNGKMVVSNETGVRFATDDRARFANPEARTDFFPIETKKKIVTPQLMTQAQFNSVIQIAADSIAKLRRIDVDRVLQSTPAAWRLDMAGRIKEARPDLAQEVDSVMAEDGQSPVDAAAHEAATSPKNDTPEPTEAQKEAGNYKVGRVNISGLDISIENPEGSTRSGTDPNGKPWSITMQSHYGYIRKTEGRDGDHVDVFVKPGTAEDYAGNVFVIDQRKANGQFDEHKVMLGWPSEEEAKAAYLANYAKGWTGLGAITPMTMDELKAWVASGNQKNPLVPKTLTERVDSAKQKKQAENAERAAKLAELMAKRKTEKAAPDVPKNPEKLDTSVERVKKTPENKPVSQERGGQKLEDFGERLDGAKKHTWASSLTAVSDVDIAASKLSDAWPHTDYQELIDNGADPMAVGLVRSLRDSIPSKPRLANKVKRWAATVAEARKVANELIEGKIKVDELRAMKDVYGRAELYAAVGHEKSLEGMTFAWRHYSLYKGKENVSFWSVEQQVAATAFSNFPREIAKGDTKEAALEAFQEEYKKLGSEAQKKKSSYVIFVEHGKDGYFIGKKIGRNTVTLSDAFKTVAEARAYRDNHSDALDKALEKYKEVPRERRDTNNPRVGEDMRDGMDATPEMFAEAFGFRGVQFGNWVEQKKRQSDLNDAYDALMDMAAVLGIPAKAISLNGELGLAFGARGSGGTNAAAAHYEPDTVVINLTKKNGAGSLGHEWWHALDGYFARMRNKGSQMTDALDVSLAARGSNFSPYPGVRREMVEAFGAVMASIAKTGMADRSRNLDRKRTKDYWGEKAEMSARAFEAYLISKLQDQNASNDYLSNIVDSKTWEAAAALGLENENSYPYPTDPEIPSIRAGFDRFFQTIETKETENGVALFSKGAEQVTTPMPQPAAETRIKSLLGDKLGKVLIESGIVSFVNQGNKFNGATYSNGSIVLNLDELNDELIDGVVAHEGFHATVKELIGEETYAQLMAQLEKLTAANVPWAKEARAAVPKDTKAGDVTEEIAAYAVQQHVSGAKLSPFLKRWVNTFLSALRTAIIRRLPFSKLKAWAVKNVQPEDLANLAMAGLKAKAQGRLQQGREAVAYSVQERDRTNIETAMRRMDKFVSEFESGRMKDSDTQILGDTPTVLQAVGAQPLQLLVDGETINKVLHNKHRYFVTAEMLRSLPNNLYDPLAVFDSTDPKTGQPGKLLLTELSDPINGEPIIVAVHLNKRHGRYVINDISSIYAANSITQSRKLTANAIEYYRNEKSLEQATTPSLDISLRDVVQSAQDLGRSLVTEDDVVNRYGVKYSKSAVIGDSGRSYNADQRSFFKNVGREIDRQNVIDRTLNYLKSDFWKKMAVGLVDQFRGLRDLNDGGQAYMLARLSKGTAGAFDALLHHGKLSLKDGAYDGDTSGGFIDRLGVPLHGELDDFLWWVAANRAEGLTAQGKENLFSPQDIQAGKSLAAGMTTFDYTIQTGPSQGTTTRNRQVIYQDALRVFNGFQKNVLDMAEQSGLIDGASRQHWETDFYVPFYRVSEEDGEFVGAKMGNALVRQQAFKKLKGGTDKLNSDLLTNTLMNLSHLIEASAKNRAATAALTAAEKIGAARKAIHGEKHTVWHMDKGQKVEYKVEDPFVMTAITSLEYAGMRNGVMDAMTKFKHWLTIGVTASPAFKVRNLIRDSIQAIGTSDLSYNPIKNVTEGFKQTKRDSQAYVSALASGGLIRFGTMLEGSESNRVRQLIKSGVKDSSILNNEAKWRQFYDKYIEPAVSAYNELGNRSEEINRAALYNQLIKQGKSHAEAALLARDLMDFSMQGSFNTIRFLSQVTPFFNARLQGMYKLGRSAKDNPRKLAVVTGAVALASIALMAGYEDDEDWKRREDWDRDGFFWFKFGGIEYRIPKPFEVGAVASLAERSVEYLMNDEMTGERFRKVVGALAMNNLSMNPVPQMVKPIIDLYANKDSFTGRPIESTGMQRLESTMRYNSSTSMPARGLSTVTLGALSPVQYDHLVRSYFGWLGSFVVGGGDMLARAMSDEPTKPALDLFKFSTQGLAKEAGTGSSRYLSMVYDQAEELEKVYATHRQLIKDRKLEEAKTYAEDNQEALGRYRQVERVKKQETLLNARIRFIERSGATADEKKAQIDALNKRKEQVAMRIAPGLN